LRHEIVQIVVGLENDAAAAPAIAAAGTSLGAIGLAQEGDASLAAVAGPGIDFYFIDKQKKSVLGQFRLWLRFHVDAAALFIEQNPSIRQGEERPIAPGADVLAGDKLGAALADQDAAGGDQLTAKFFDAEAFADAVASVAHTALTFLMCHNLFS
jgi:hypothetical protein